MLGKHMEMKFSLQIDDETKLSRINADVFRLYELLKATIEVHAHNGFHVITSSCENRERQ